MVFVKRVIVSRLSITVREVMAAPIFKLRYTSVQLASSTVKAKVLSGGVMGLSFLQLRFKNKKHKQTATRTIKEWFFIVMPYAIQPDYLPQ